ncbi:zinc finger protein, partial [Striga asiatica]
FLDIKRTSPEGNLNVADFPSFAISFATVPAALTNCPPFPSVLSIKTPSQTVQASSKAYGFLDVDDDIYTDGSYIYRTMKYHTGGYPYESKSAESLMAFAAVSVPQKNSFLPFVSFRLGLLSCLRVASFSSVRTGKREKECNPFQTGFLTPFRNWLEELIFSSSQVCLESQFFDKEMALSRLLSHPPHRLLHM